MMQISLLQEVNVKTLLILIYNVLFWLIIVFSRWGFSELYLYKDSKDRTKNSIQQIIQF